MKQIAAFFHCMLLLFLLTFSMCRSGEKEQTGNPPAQGFHLAGSDPKAIQIADSVMVAQGGRQNWDATRYISWNFFGSRKLIWDKYTGNVRVENVKDDTKILVNINSGKGKVFKNGAEVAQPDSLAKYLKEGKEAWINDSYWLVMPFKLKDSGVTLKYLQEDTLSADRQADVLELTFQKVGVTPENKYRVYVDKASHLVAKWAYYKNATDSTPAFVMPWQDYQTYGRIKLSGDRGQAKLTDIQVLDNMPETVFTSFAPVDLSQPKEARSQ